ncbi:hypothetical protein QBC38DRAFT_82801 [Podospora fimiseda]|uniref:Secreted protein n=1 Tax=Podospora fimiseda TaxID=252190 RepID=A0AAN6YQ40_9PEZI|nr:hypothetical protein QBC38DRAFT_82801 [Podospora fimiseda]
MISSLFLVFFSFSVIGKEFLVFTAQSTNITPSGKFRAGVAIVSSLTHTPINSPFRTSCIPPLPSLLRSRFEGGRFSDFNLQVSSCQLAASIQGCSRFPARNSLARGVTVRLIELIY